MFIDSAWTDARSGRTFHVFDPATGEVIGEVPDGGSDDARDAVAAAQRAFAGWSAATARERADVLYRAWELMVDRSEQLATLMTREQGKPLRASRTEVAYASDFLRFYAEEATRVGGEWLPSARADQRFLVMRQAVGVAAMITPWNYPISMLTRKMAPALAAGCTLVLKPAEETPLCARAVFEVFADAGAPAGTVNLVTTSEPAAVGEVFTDDPRVAKLSFTGSTGVGRHLAAAAVKSLKRVSVELGGHAPFLVFPDADPVRAAKGAAALKFLNSGQACISPNRLYVSRRHEDAFVSTMVERVGRVRVGNGFDDGVGVGPLVNEAAVEKVADQVDDAVERGAEALVGGARLVDEPFDRGHFYEPTVLAGVCDGMKIYREETFGPVAPIIVYDDDDELITLANDTNYGLAAYVYTQDLSTAIRSAEQLRFGIIGVNDVNPTAASVPFGGWKDSGMGREGSHDGLEEYLETKVAGFAI